MSSQETYTPKINDYENTVQEISQYNDDDDEVILEDQPEEHLDTSSDKRPSGGKRKSRLSSKFSFVKETSDNLVELDLKNNSSVSPDKTVKSGSTGNFQR